MMDRESLRLILRLVLAHHVRSETSGCLCGWHELGEYWSGHIVEVCDRVEKALMEEAIE
jgi:hypothetical protein